MFNQLVRVVVYMICLLLVPSVVWGLFQLNDLKSFISIFISCYTIYLSYAWANGDKNTRIWLSFFLGYKGIILLYPSILVFTALNELLDESLSRIFFWMIFPSLMSGFILVGISAFVFLSRESHSRYSRNLFLEKALRSIDSPN
jgi:heme/copper-type cytochrome/quinol oxidase subunit 3